MDFIGEALLGFPRFEIPDRFDVSFMNVECDGKSRSVTVADALQHLLGPLHRTIYGRLSEERWLLRGEAKPSRFDDFHVVSGEVFVSGDYTCATDNLSLEVAEAMLQEMRRSARRIPDRIFEYALSSLRARVHYPDLNIALEQVRGQLMGNLLSFPLLCLQNYIAFRWSVGASAPVRINGDDIVFRAPPEVADRWAANVGSLGLTLCVGKTLRDKRFFSLNSTFFSFGFKG